MDASEKQRQKTIWQLVAIGLVLIIGLLIIMIPRRADEPSEDSAPGKRVVSVHLCGEALGPLMLSGVALSADDAARVTASTVPLGWYAGVGFDVADASLRAEPEAALALERMLVAYTSTNATYTTPIVTGAYTVGSASDSVYAGGYTVELSLMVPSGDEMATVPLTGPLAATFRAWLVSHAAYYGFTVTGAGTLRYVGTPHAAYLFSQSVTLEDYVALVKTKTQKAPLVVETGGVYYEIFFAKAKDGAATVKLTEGAAFTASGTNAGGFIVTVLRTVE